MARVLRAWLHARQPASLFRARYHAAGRPRRYDSRFFYADVSAVAVRSEVRDGELSSLDWFTFDEMCGSGWQVIMCCSEDGWIDESLCGEVVWFFYFSAPGATLFFHHPARLQPFRNGDLLLAVVPPLVPSSRDLQRSEHGTSGPKHHHLRRAEPVLDRPITFLLAFGESSAFVWADFAVHRDPRFYRGPHGQALASASARS